MFEWIINAFISLKNLKSPTQSHTCKAQKSDIKVGEIRKLKRDNDNREGIQSRGFFFTSSGFFKKAWEKGTGQGLELIDGYNLMAKIKNLPQEKQEAILQEITNTDYMTPTCTACGIKMTKRTSTPSNEKFWGCINYPRCQVNLKFRWTDK